MNDEVRNVLKIIFFVFIGFIFTIILNVIAHPQKKAYISDTVKQVKSEIVEKQEKTERIDISGIINTVGMFFLLLPFIGMLVAFYMVLRKSKDNFIEYVKPQDRVRFL